MTVISTINWVSVLVGLVAYSILGGLWFTVIFKKPYFASLGKANEPEQKPAPIFIIGPAICSLAMTITHAILISALNIQSFSQTIEFALVVGIGYLAANTVNIAINPNMPKPLFYSAISGAYHLVGIVLVSIIIFAMR